MPELRPVLIQGDDGAPIPFGERWRDLPETPAEAYSVVTHPERYAQLHEVADALVAHLLATYDCEVVEEPPRGQGVRELRAVRIASVPGTAPVRIAWTDFPGVVAEVGLDVPAAAPICGCDACDEPLERAAEGLAEAVLSRVRGRGGAAWPER